MIEGGEFFFLIALVAALILLSFFTLKTLERFKGERNNKELLDYMEQLKAGQQKLSGVVEILSNNQATNNSHLIGHVESRLSEVQRQIFDSLNGSATKTAQSLGALQQRLTAIDKAQDNLEKLSGNVLSLQDILSNKQTRGAFGEIQLFDIVSKALPPDSFSFQKLLSNGKRVDCMIYLPNPPGPIAIDSKFPLESYDAMRVAKDDIQKKKAIQDFRKSIKGHISDISEKYILEGETAEGAIMFLPSESVYAELHANFSDLVRDGFSKRVWVVSPTTCMATLNTIRAILKDARFKEHSSKIRENLGLLFKDVSRLGDRIANLDKHFLLANKDLREVKLSVDKVTGRADKLDSLNFEELSISEADKEKDTRSEFNVISS